MLSFFTVCGFHCCAVSKISRIFRRINAAHENGSLHGNGDQTYVTSLLLDLEDVVVLAPGAITEEGHIRLLLVVPVPNAASLLRHDLLVGRSVVRVATEKVIMKRK